MLPYPRISMAPVGQLSAASCAVRRQSSGTASVMAWAGAPSSSENTSGQMLGHSPHWIQAFWFTFAYIAAHYFIKIENSCIMSIGAGNYSGSGTPCIITRPKQVRLRPLPRWNTTSMSARRRFREKRYTMPSGSR